MTSPDGGHGDYVVDADAAALESFVREVRSHGHTYRAEWHPLSNEDGLGSPGVGFDDIRSELYWLFEDWRAGIR